MQDLPKKKQEIYAVQKAILAYLNAQSDNRAGAKDLIINIDVKADIFCQSIRLLNEQGFVRGPEFTQAMILEGGNNSFRDSTKLTASGQEKYVEMIKQDQK